MKTTQKAALSPYTTPVVSTKDPKDWYVFFEFFHAGKWHKRKLREGINRVKDPKQRKIDADGLRAAREAWLKQGWNPIIDPEFNARKLAKNADIKTMGFNEAISFAFEKKSPDLAKKSRQDYRNILEHVKAGAIKTGLAYLSIRETTRLHVLELLQYLAEDRAMSNHRYNMFLGCIRSMFTTLETWTVVEYNPASKIPTKAVVESDKFASFTEEEKVRISECLAAKHYRLFVFVQFIYHTGIRPKELLALRVGDIDLQRRLITLRPDILEERTKTPFIRPVPVSNALYPFVKEMLLSQWPGDFFVFGSPFKPGEGNRGSSANMIQGERRPIRHNSRNGFITGFKTGVSGAMRPDYLIPSPYQASRDTVGRLWATLVKDTETGLGINKCLYAAKHTGADDKILAGIDLDALRNLYGHRSKQMTERYAKQVREIWNSSIIENAPGFTDAKKPGKLRKIA